MLKLDLQVSISLKQLQQKNIKTNHIMYDYKTKKIKSTTYGI